MRRCNCSTKATALLLLVSCLQAALAIELDPSNQDCNQDYKAGVRKFPALVAETPEVPGVETSRRAIPFWSEQWEGETFMAIGMQDPVLGPPAMRSLQRLIRNCPEPMEIADGGHFVQEWGEPIARAAVERFGLQQG